MIITGSQLPLGVLRTDGRENFISAIEIAAALDDETPVVPEVCIFLKINFIAEIGPINIMPKILMLLYQAIIHCLAFRAFILNFIGKTFINPISKN